MSVAAQSPAPYFADWRDRYELVGKIGSGGFAEVYEAYDLTLDEAVALKIVPDGRALSARIVREVEAAASLDHPNIVALYDWFADGEGSILVWELVRGDSLDKLGHELERRGRGGRRRRAPRRARLRAQPGHRAPRRQAAERHARRRRPRQGHGLRHRPPHGLGHADGRRRRDRHHRLHVAGAGGRTPRPAAERRLLGRHGAVRAARRGPPAARGHPGRDALQRRRRAAAVAGRAAAGPAGRARHAGRRRLRAAPVRAADADVPQRGLRRPAAQREPPGAAPAARPSAWCGRSAAPPRSPSAPAARRSPPSPAPSSSARCPPTRRAGRCRWSPSAAAVWAVVPEAGLAFLLGSLAFPLFNVSLSLGGAYLAFAVALFLVARARPIVALWPAFALVLTPAYLTLLAPAAAALLGRVRGPLTAAWAGVGTVLFLLLTRAPRGPFTLEQPRWRVARRRRRGRRPVHRRRPRARARVRGADAAAGRRLGRPGGGARLRAHAPPPRDPPLDLVPLVRRRVRAVPHRAGRRVGLPGEPVAARLECGRARRRDTLAAGPDHRRSAGGRRRWGSSGRRTRSSRASSRAGSGARSSRACSRSSSRTSWPRRWATTRRSASPTSTCPTSSTSTSARTTTTTWSPSRTRSRRSCPTT